MKKKESYKMLRLLLFISWVLIGLSLIGLPYLMGDRFDMETGQKLTNIYLVVSVIFPPLINYILKKKDKY